MNKKSRSWKKRLPKYLSAKMSVDDKHLCDDINEKRMKEEKLFEEIANGYTLEQGKKIEEEIQRVNSCEREEYEDKITVSLEDILSLESESRKAKKKRKVLPVLYKVAAMAAALLLVFDVSIVAVPAFRMNMLRFFEKSARTHTRVEVSSEENDEVLEGNDRYSTGPKVEYRVNYLPEGFAVVSEKRNDVSLYTEYKNSKDDFIALSQKIDNKTINFDTEDATTYHRIINESDVLIAVKNNNVSAIWRVEGYLLWMSSENVSENEFLKIVESIKKE